MPLHLEKLASVFFESVSKDYAAHFNGARGTCSVCVWKMRRNILYVSQADKPRPAPNEEIIKQSVINPEVMGGNAMFPEMIFVKIWMMNHLPILD